MTMDPVRQSIDLSRLVIAKEFFASPVKAPSKRSPRAPPSSPDFSYKISLGGPCAPFETGLPPPQTDAEPPSPQLGGWPLRLSNIANQLTPSPEKKLRGSPQFLERSPNSASPGLSAFLQESPALFSEPREAARGPNGGVETVGAQGGVRGNITRSLRFGGLAPSSCEIAPVPQGGARGQESERLTSASPDPSRRERMQSNERATERIAIKLTPLAGTQLRAGQPEGARVNSGADSRFVRSGLLPAPPKRTPPLLRRSRTRQPFSQGENQPQRLGVNVHKTPVGWVGFDEARAENDENRQRAWASGVRNVTGLQIRTVVGTGEGGSSPGTAKSPLGCFSGARLEVPKRSPVNSKAILKSPLGGRDGSGSEEGRTRLAAPTREPFQQVSENAALNGDKAVSGGKGVVRFEQEGPKKLRSPSKPSTLGRPSPLGKGYLPSPTKPLTSKTTSQPEPGGHTAAPESPSVLHVSLSGELPPAELQNCSMQGPERDGVFAQTGVNSSGRSEVLIIEPVHTAARTELEGGVDVPPKSGPQFEDTEFRAGLAALRKLKLESEQGLQKGSSEPADGSLRWELRQSVSGSLAGSFDTGNDTPSKAAVKDSKVSVEDGANQEKAVKESGKGKWSFGFGRSGKKSVSLEMPQESDVGLGQETADGTDKETSRDFGGEGARGKIEKESAKGEGNGKKRQGGDGSGGKGGKKKRKDKKGAVENGAEAAPTETQNAAKTSGEEDSRLKTDGDDVSGSVDVSGAPEKRPKKGLLRKALRLKRSKKGKPQAEEVAEAAQEGMTRGEPAKIEEGTQAGSCHVAGETRAKDTPVKITLEGVRIVVRPKNADADVGTPEQDEGGGQVDVSSPAVLMSAAGARTEAAPSNTLPVPTTDDRMRLLAAALERAHQSSPQKATIRAENALPTSPKLSLSATCSPQLLSLYGRSPLGSAERLEEVRRRMEARARVLGDQGHAPRAARRLRMDGAVAANACVTVGREGLFGESLRSAEQEANEVDKADAREPQTEREGESQKSVTDAEAGDGDKYPEEVVKPVDLRAGSEVEKKNAGVIRTEEANGTERPEAHEADGMRNPSAPAAAAASVVAAGALNPQAPPAAACTEAPEKAIAPEAEEIAAVPEARADGVATSATAAEEATADDVLTSPSLEEEVSPAERVFDGQSEPRSPAEPLVGAAAFFRGASSRPIFAPGRGSQNGWVGSTGHEDQATASFGEETGSGKEPEPEEAETERNEKTKNDLVESSVGSSEKESSGRLAVSEGDLPPVRDAVESPAGHGDKTGASGAERSPEEPFRGAAAFFLHANVTPSKVPASYGIGFALRAACSPAVDRPLTDRSAVDEGNTPAVLHPTARPVSVAIEPDQIGTTSILGEPTTPPKRIENVGVRSEDGFEVGGSFSASLQGVADAQARAVSPEERVPNAAAFFGRRAAASPVRPRVALPLQELKGFENRPAVEGSGKAVGTESGKPTKGALREKPLSGAKMSTQRPAEPSSVKHKSGTADQNPPPLPVAPSVPIWVETSPSSQVAALSVIADVTAPVADVSPATPAAIGPEMRQKTVPKTVVQSPEGQRALGNGVPEEAVSRLPKPSSEEVVPASLMESERDSDKAVGAETVEQLSDGQRRGSVLDMVRQHEAAGRERREEKTGEPAQVTKSPVKAPPRQTVPDATVAAPAAATAVLAPQMDALLRENQRLKAQVVLLQEEKHRIAKQMEASSLKATGNAAFAKGKFDDAKRAYNRALELRVSDNQFNSVIYTNRAAANLALGATMDALADCAAALHIDANCAGAVLRKVDACLAIGDWQTALGDLSALEKAGTGTDDVRRKMHDLKSKMWRAPAQLDFYGILELSPRSNMTAVKNAYKRLALRYHPDRAGPHADLVFQYVARAYQVLSNPFDKKKYDAQLQRALQ